jgi:predicted PurR-regulated permease PerM
MDILRNLFGSLASGIIRLLVTVGILAAAYFSIVKPVLKTTDNAINKTNSAFEHSFGDNGLKDISKALEDVNKQVQVQVHRSFHVAKKNGNPKRLVHCVQRADGDVHRIKRCAAKF